MMGLQTPEGINSTLELTAKMMNLATEKLKRDKEVIKNMAELLEECRLLLKHTCHERDALGCRACSLESRIENVLG